jgi:hypothetical protein
LSFQIALIFLLSINHLYMSAAMMKVNFQFNLDFLLMEQYMTSIQFQQSYLTSNNQTQQNKCFSIFISSTRVNSIYAFYVGYSDITGLWEATKIKNHDENAWSWWRAILVDFIWIFSCLICDLHIVFRDIRLSLR